MTQRYLNPVLALRSTILPREHHPRSGTCPRHLRRICGTCAQFTGGLHGRGDCRVYQINGMSSSCDASLCEDWERKSAQ